MKPVNMGMPAYLKQKNQALNEIINVSANPVHEAHVRKAQELQHPKTKFETPNQNPGVGNPWLSMQKAKK